ncbi:hypothetical protein E4U42_003175 [Claviceps africana]|uniref:Peptidase M20 dimerisation domain-containing protein n=1 Tax=Claviceps africana TaxID=83212 RepID=A0A8K0NLS6_9HYPO|nr:hypothetical protein E4U42_003175 [Claviceps africana]
MRSLSAIAFAWALARVAFCQEAQRPLHDSKQLHAWQTHQDDDDAAAPSYRHELLHLHKQLVSIPSISGDENAVGNFLVEYLAERGYHAELQIVRALHHGTAEGKERFNVLAWKGQREPEASPRIVVSSHIDVVPPHIPYAIESGQVTKNTMIKGRGSVDAKGSVASMITALNQLHRSRSIETNDVMLLFVVGEETTGDGMQAFSDSLSRGGIGGKHPFSHFEAVIFGEPTENKLACGHKGGLFCDIVAKGVPGHSGYPWLGKSANELMVRAMAKVLDADLGSSDLYGNTTFNIGRFDGGVANNVIPERAKVKFAARVAIGPESSGHKFVKEKVERILEELDKDAFEMTCTHGYGFVESNCNVDGFEKITVNYGTDIPNLAGNHTRYLYGPGNILVAHGARENLTVADLEEAVEGYQRLILHALKQ